MSQPQTPQTEGPGAHHGHGLMMILCCIPLLVVAVVLVAIGAISASFLSAALGCLAMMAMTTVMMGGMDRRGGDRP